MGQNRWLKCLQGDVQGQSKYDLPEPMSSGRFSKGWTGTKNCKDCSSPFLSTSGNRRFCDDCIASKSICLECKGHKSIYHQFCSNSCAGKWKYRNSEKVRKSIKYGRESPNRGIGISLYRRGRKRPEITGENSISWKGDSVGYCALHAWVVRHKGKAMLCEFCSIPDSTRYEWANKSHEYKRDLEDWIQLCKRCHMAYDKGYMGSIKNKYGNI